MDGVEIISVLVGSSVLLGLFFLPISYRNRGYKSRKKLAPVIER
jgi:hypothetical protein